MAVKPDISVDLFKIDEDGYVWTAVSTLPDGFRPGDHLLGDGGDAAPAVARVVDMDERWVRFQVLAGPADEHRHLLRGRPAA